MQMLLNWRAKLHAFHASPLGKCLPFQFLIPLTSKITSSSSSHQSPHLHLNNTSFPSNTQKKNYTFIVTWDGRLAAINQTSNEGHGHPKKMQRY